MDMNVLVVYAASLKVQSEIATTLERFLARLKLAVCAVTIIMVQLKIATTSEQFLVLAAKLVACAVTVTVAHSKTATTSTPVRQRVQPLTTPTAQAKPPTNSPAVKLLTC